MKTIIAIFIFQYAVLTAYSQSITSISVIPSNSTTNDFVKVEVNTLFVSGSCWLMSNNQTQNGNVFDITGRYCSGMATVMCPRTDTFNLGYLQAGTYTVNFQMHYYGWDGNIGQCDTVYSDTDNASLSFTVTQPTVGIHESPYFDFISVYPNPSSGVFNLKMSQFENLKMKSVEVYNVFGEKVYNHFQINASSPENSGQIDLSSQPSGVYFLSIKTEQESYTQKLIIQK